VEKPHTLKFKGFQVSGLQVPDANLLT